MKRIPAFICFLSLLLTSSYTAAQRYSNEPGSMYTLTAGLTSSNLLKDSVHFRAGTLFSGGLGYIVVLSDRINIELEALYSGKAFKSDDPIVKYRFYYADIPLIMQYKFSESFRLNIGGQYSKFVHSQRIAIDGAAKGGTGSHKYDYENIKDMDYAFLAGLEINLGENFALGTRYTVSGSTFFEQNQPNFGVFPLSLIYVAHRSYKQLFHKSETK